VNAERYCTAHSVLLCTPHTHNTIVTTGTISKHQFVGSMAFLRFMNSLQDHEADTAAEDDNDYRYTDSYNKNSYN
jgi:hypothetical protein